MVVLPIRNLILYVVLTVPSLFAQNPRQPGQLATTYTPLTNEEKFKYRIVESLEVQGFLGATLGASAEQIAHSPREWGRGIEGYGKRFVSTFGGALVRQSLNYGFETLLKEDPRYFPADGPSTKRRIWSALKQTFVTRTDSGGTTPAYGRIASAFVTGQITRAWFPPSADSLPDGVRNSGISLGGDLLVNLVYEFFPGSRPAETPKP